MEQQEQQQAQQLVGGEGEAGSESGESDGQI
jgi:hypothetical protein